MIQHIIIRRSSKSDGENPFWISFSDLMTALMTLFLVVMAVTLISVTKDVTAEEQRKVEREADIRTIMAAIEKASRELPGVHVNATTYRIELNEEVRFDSGRSDIQPEGARFLRHYIPTLLDAANLPEGKRWIRRIVVEGFTDQDGSYLYNLGLSLDRSKRVVCTLFAKPKQDETSLTGDQLRQIRDLFLVGGYSFNSMKASKEASRRVEFKIEFWPVDDKPDTTTAPDSRDFGQC